MAQDDTTTQQADSTNKPLTAGVGEAGRQLGPNRLIRRIGRGGMGEVWLARHELLGHEVAVKILSTAVMDRTDPAFREFIQGARAAASLGHPGLNKVHHADVVDGVPYLVLEFLDGPNLRELVERSGRLDLAAVRAVIEAVGEAVAELHHHDLVHRDLKPSNFMVTAGGRIVITDFGLACASPASALRGKSGLIAGTPAYMAPEMFDGVVSARTDVYAIGMTAYELLCGRPAFVGTLDELQRQHKSVAIDVEPLRAAGVPEEVIDVVVRATSKDVLFRPKTARHVLGAFRTAFDEAGIQPASRESLMRLLQVRAEARADHTAPNAATAGTMAETVAQFAARKRDLHDSAPPQSYASSKPIQAIDPADAKRRRAERRRVRIAGLAASAAGAFAAIIAFMVFLRISSWWEHWVEVDLARTKGVPATAPAFAISGSSPIWARLFLFLAPVCAFVGIAVGFATLLYSLLRGRPLPNDAGKTLCGWCQHELRGIPTPVCAECGHRIGDRGPDDKGLLPLGRQWQWRLRAGLLVPFVFPVAALVAYVPLSVVMWLLPFSNPTVGTPPMLITAFVAVFIALATTLAFQEGILQFALSHSGRSWCRTCQGELRDLSEPICPTCGARI